MKNIIISASVIAIVATAAVPAFAADNKTTGLVGGAVTGAVVGGPVGAVVGGAVGLTTGAAIDDSNKKTVIIEKDQPDVVIHDNQVDDDE